MKRIRYSVVDWNIWEFVCALNLVSRCATISSVYLPACLPVFYTYIRNKILDWSFSIPSFNANMNLCVWPFPKDIYIYSACKWRWYDHKRRIGYDLCILITTCYYLFTITTEITNHQNDAHNTPRSECFFYQKKNKINNLSAIHVSLLIQTKTMDITLTYITLSLGEIHSLMHFYVLFWELVAAAQLKNICDSLDKSQPTFDALVKHCSNAIYFHSSLLLLLQKFQDALLFVFAHTVQVGKTCYKIVCTQIIRGNS